MHVFVINLKRSQGRLENIEGQLSALGIKFQISEGVDAMNFSRDEEALYKEGLREGRKLSPGHFGSSWAHIKVYERIVREKIPKALVLEDDVVISRELPRILKENWVNESFWEFVHLGYPSASWKGLKQWFFVSWQRTKCNPFFGIYFFSKIPFISSIYFYEFIREKVATKIRPAPSRFARPLYLGAGYLITLEGAQKILSIAYPIRFLGDQLFNQARVRVGLRFYGYVPPPIRTNDNFISEANLASLKYNQNP